MAVEMAKLFLSGLSTTSDMLSLAIFKGTALLLVLILRVLQVPGWGINCVLCLIRHYTITAIEKILEIAGEWLVSAVSTGSEIITDATTAAVSSFLETAKETQELFVNAIAEVHEFAFETASKIASTLWENFWEAVDILIKYAANN